MHCGDSRLYVVRDGRLLVRTRDHSHAERPKPTGSDAPVNRNLLLTCLGSPTTPLFDVSAPMPLQRGDRIMLCSDGVWGVLDEETIVHTLSSGKPVSDAAPDLAEMALRKGGSHSDNVTLIALEWEMPDSADDRSGVSTETIEDGVFASTIQAGMPSDSEIDDLDEDAIERSIAEINEAIRRSAARKS
jgi:serine/threonine protein phosphatase PrpC